MCDICIGCGLCIYAQEVTVFQINAKWNQSNNNYDTRGLKKLYYKIWLFKKPT